jgi:NitT/TauT family transport system ATP-binding protein
MEANTLQATTVSRVDEAAATAPRPDVGKLNIRHVGKIYNPDTNPVVAVEDSSIDVEAGDFLAIVGPSGCGKSTLMNIIAGFDNVTSGEIYLDDELLASAKHAPRPGSDRVVVFQNGALFPWKTVLENVMYGPLVQRQLDPAEIRAKAMYLLRSCGGLDGVANAYPAQLSSGMQRRVEIVRALMNDPKILLLDEPFRAMDTVSKTTMHEHLLQMYRVCRKTIIFITHDLEEAIFLADKVVVMTSRPGKLKDILHVDLPRPRDAEMLASDEFRRLKAQLSSSVHAEAKRAFERGEREQA